MRAALHGATLVYFDGCLTEAALEVARAARAKGIKVLKCLVIFEQFLQVIIAAFNGDRLCSVLSSPVPSPWAAMQNGRIHDSIRSCAATVRCQAFAAAGSDCAAITSFQNLCGLSAAKGMASLTTWVCEEYWQAGGQMLAKPAASFHEQSRSLNGTAPV